MWSRIHDTNGKQLNYSSNKQEAYNICALTASIYPAGLAYINFWFLQATYCEMPVLDNTFPRLYDRRISRRADNFNFSPPPSCILNVLENGTVFVMQYSPAAKSELFIYSKKKKTLRCSNSVPTLYYLFTPPPITVLSTNSAFRYAFVVKLKTNTAVLLLQRSSILLWSNKDRE